MSLRLDVGYPLYGAQYVDSNAIVVTGGGGEGNNGIPNKISHIAIKGGKLEVVDEYEFQGATDSPTSLDIVKDTLIVSVNSTSENVKKGNNKHLQRYSFNKDEEKNFKFDLSVDLEKSKDPNEYQKVVVLSRDGKQVLALSSKTPSTLRLVDSETLTLRRTFVEEKEIKDANLSPSGKAVAYITDTKLVLHNLETNETYEHNRFTSNYVLSKVKLLSDKKIIVGVNLKNKAGILLLESNLIKDEEKDNQLVLKTKKARVVTDKVKKITGLDIYSDKLAAIAGNDNSITIVDLQDFTLCKIYPKVHSFAITKVVFAPDGKTVASVSAASTLSVITIPDNIAVKYTGLKWTAYILLVALFISFVKRQVPDEQWTAVNVFIHELFDDGQIDPEEYERLSLSWESAEAAKTLSLEAEATKALADGVEYVNASDEEVETTTTTTTRIVLETHTLIDDDIVNVVTKSNANTE